MAEKNYAIDGSEYPDCPKCKNSNHVTKNGSVERDGQVFQAYRCGGCGKGWY